MLENAEADHSAQAQIISDSGHDDMIVSDHLTSKPWETTRQTSGSNMRFSRFSMMLSLITTAGDLRLAPQTKQSKYSRLMEIITD